MGFDCIISILIILSIYQLLAFSVTVMVMMMVMMTMTAMAMEVVDVSLKLVKVLPHQFRSILLETHDQVRKMNKILQTSGDRLKSLLLATSCCKVDPRTVNPP